MLFNCVIIGAGQIGAGYDEPDSSVVLTHAHAIKLNPKLNLIGFYDVDFERANNASEKWQGETLKNIDDVKCADVIVIAVPDMFHKTVLEQIKDSKCKLVILEKPIADNLDSTLQIVKAQYKFPIQVNFSRRYVSDFQKLAKDIQEKKYGEFQTGYGVYCNGFVHNASHMLDLLRMLVGEISKVNVLDGHDKIDKAVSVLLENEKTFFIESVNSKFYTVFELELYFDKAKIQILDSGNIISIYKPQVSNIYQGYSYLEYTETIKTDLQKSMINLYENVVNFLTCQDDLIMSLDKAYSRWLYV